MTGARVAVVCDDDPMIRMVASALLRDNGFDVIETASGTELVGALAPGVPDLVVLDHELPDAKGEDLIVEIMATSPTCRVIVFSGREPAVSGTIPVFARVPKRGTDDLAAAIHRAATE